MVDGWSFGEEEESDNWEKEKESGSGNFQKRIFWSRKETVAGLVREIVYLHEFCW